MALDGGHENATTSPRNLPKWAGYAITVVLEIGLTAFLLAINPYLPLGEHAIVYVVAMMAVAYWLGEGPATLAFFMGLFAFAHFFIPPTGHIWPPASTVTGWGMYGVFFIGTAAVGAAMVFVRRSQRRTKLLANRVARSEETVRCQLALLQKALLPPQPFAISGYRSHAVYLPASPGLQIGGDFYDVLKTENGKIAVLIGDVSGKGVEAAALAATARGTIHAFAFELSAAGPSLAHANSVLFAQEDEPERYVTVFLAIIDPLTGTMCYARAGHPPCAICRKEGAVEFLASGGIPAGLFARQEYESLEACLDPGDRLVMYTDGILEARRATELFETSRIEQALIAHGRETGDQLALGLLGAARDWAEGQLRDDIAIVTLERGNG